MGQIDKRRQAVSGDVEAIFETILILSYYNQLKIEGSTDPVLDLQFLAYKIMGIACEVLRQEPLSSEDLRRRSLDKVRQDRSFDSFANDYITNLIPASAIKMVQHLETTEIQYKNCWGAPESYTEKQQGILLGRYDREETVRNLQREKENGKAVYLVLGRGNRQLTPADQKTAEGKEIVWVYLDQTTWSHSTYRRDYFLWEDFNGTLSRRLPEGFFNGVVFDRSVTKFIHDELLTVIQIAKILTSDGFLFFPLEGILPPVLYRASQTAYEFPFGSVKRIDDYYGLN